MFRAHRRVSPAGRRRLTYANVTSTIALVLALGGGTAYAAHHYLITSKSQISPKVLKKLRGNVGPRGLTGAQGPRGLQGLQGTQGVQGIQGNIGPQGPGAVQFVATDVPVGDQSPASGGVGTIPVFLTCAVNGGNPPSALLNTTETSGGSFASTFTVGAADNGSGFPNTTPQVNQYSAPFSDNDYLAYDATNPTTPDVSIGSVLLVYKSGTLLDYTTTTETVNFEMSNAGSGGTGTCSITAQIVSNSTSTHLTL